MGNAAEVGNDGLDTVALALDLGLETLHLVAVKGVGHILQNELAGCRETGAVMLTRRMLTVAMIAVKLEFSNNQCRMRVESVRTV